MSIVFDITNGELALEFLSTYTDISKVDILKSITTSIANDSSEYSNEFIEVFNIEVSELNVFDIECAILHMTTNNDECESLKKYGIMDLQKVLTVETPLKQYLEGLGITFDIDKKLMYIDGTPIDIEYKSHQIGSSETNQYIREVARKIYFDNQINGFFSLNDWNDYGGLVNKRPEILFNIGCITGDYIEDDWFKCNEAYEIKFKAKLEQIEYFTFYGSKEESYEDFKENYCNLKRWFLENSIDIIWCNYKSKYEQIPKKAAYMKPSTIIEWRNVIGEINFENKII